MLSTKFNGRIIQVIEALDFGDAVSNHVMVLDGIFKSMGFKASIYSKWHDGKVEDRRSYIEDLKLTDLDVVILHYAGYSEFALPLVADVRCIKICVYHNITPAEFFDQGTPGYEFCNLGRQQLKEVVQKFDYFWGDSHYNLQELIELGVDEDRCALIPIIIEPGGVHSTETDAIRRARGSWLFVGRIARNKGHINLVRLFAKVRADNRDIAQHLYIAGRYSEEDSCYRDLMSEVHSLGIASQVSVMGKLLDEEIEDLFARSSIYVSLSEHEGFGVPLIEASAFGLPVVALDTSAVGETLGESEGLVKSIADMPSLVKYVLSDEECYKAIVKAQKINAERFSTSVVSGKISEALKKIVPERHRFNTVSIVICTYNRGDFLERCLDYLQYQTNQNFEVVVINGPSDDNTVDVIKKYSDRIKYASNPERNLAKSRNIGIELADGDLIAFIDDDAIPFDDWVDTLLREFSQRPLKTAAIGGPAYFSGTLKYQVEDIAINRFAEARINVKSELIGRDGWERSMLGTNTCFRADLLRAVNGFDEQFDYFLDESELSFRLQKCGYVVGYSPELYLRHEFAQSANRTSKHNFNWQTICKNTTYYISAYSGLKGKELDEYLGERMRGERVVPLEAALRDGEIGQSELDLHTRAIHAGVKQGLIDAKAFPRTRKLQPSPKKFKAYGPAAASYLIGRDIVPLHICILTKEFPPFVPGGGIGTLYYHLVSELLMMGHHVSVVTPGNFSDVFRQGRFSIHYVAQQDACRDAVGASGFTRNMNWSLSALAAISKIHVGDPIDVIDSALWDSESLALALLPKKQRPPLVVRLVTPFPVATRINNWSMPETEYEYFTAAEKTLIANADAVVPISESIATTIEKEYGINRDSRWTRSYCGIAYWPSFDFSTGYAELTDIGGRSFDIPKTAKIILFLGRLEMRKGIDLVLAASNEFLASDPSAHLVLAGRDVEGWSTAERAIIEKKFDHRVHFVGGVDDSTREKLLSRAYVVLFPSRYESFGLVPLEAFVHGTPVIAARAGAIPEVVAHEECGLLFESDSSESLGHQVKRLLADVGLRERLSVGAKMQIRKFGSRVSAIETVRLYANLLDQEVLASRLYSSPRRAKNGDGETSHSFSYTGLSPALRTEVGYRDGSTLHSQSQEGYLVYGPYVVLAAGRYRAILEGNVVAAGKPNAFVEILESAAPNAIITQQLDQTGRDAIISSMDFELSQEAKLEVRVWVPQDGKVAINKLTILAEVDF